MISLDVPNYLRIAPWCHK